MTREQDGRGTSHYIAEVHSTRGARLAHAIVRADSLSDAREQVADWEVYEVHVKTNLGGGTWETVFADSEETARRDAYERNIQYSETVDAEVYDYETEVKVRPEAEVRT